MISFGTSGGSKQTASAGPTRLALWNAEQEKLATPLWGVAAEGLTKPVPSYPGQMYTPELPQETSFINLAGNQANAFGGYQEAINRVLSGQAVPNFSPADTEAYFKNAILPGMRQSYTDIAIPKTSEAYAGPGYWGSARAGALERLASDETTAEQTTLANLMYQNQLMNWQAGMAAANQMTALSPVMANMALGATGTAGEYARMIDERQKMADYQRWLSGETVDGVSPTQYNPFVQLAFQYLGLSPFTYGQTSTSSGTQGGGFRMGILA